MNDFVIAPAPVWRVYVEMTYDDYRPTDQSTPSRLEAGYFFSQEEADAAEAAAKAAIATLPESIKEYFACWTEKPFDVPNGGLESLLCSIADMAAHYIERDGLDEDDEPETKAKKELDGLGKEDLIAHMGWNDDSLKFLYEKRPDGKEMLAHLHECALEELTEYYDSL